MLLHTDTFTHRRFTQRGFYTQTPLHTDVLSHRRFDTQTFLHTNSFTHRPCCTKTLLHRRFYTQTPCAETLLHAEALTHKSLTHKHVYTQMLLQTELFLPQFLMKFDTQTRLHTDAFTDRRIVFTSVFDDRTSFRAHGLRPTLQNRNFTSVFDDRTSFRAKRLHVAAEDVKSHFFYSFWRSNLISCERVAFRGASLALPRALGEKYKRGREGKRARGQEGNRARGQEGKRARGQEREDVKMRKCEDEKMWRCFKMYITDPHYWANPSLRRSQEKSQQVTRDSLGKTLPIWRFPEMGVPLVIIHLNGIFRYKPSSYWGTPIIWKPPYVPFYGWEKTCGPKGVSHTCGAKWLLWHQPRYSEKWEVRNVTSIP